MEKMVAGGEQEGSRNAGTHGLSCVRVSISSSAGCAGARPHRNFRERDARFATSSWAPAGIWFARRLLRGGGFGYNKELALCHPLAAPCHPIPRRVLPPARLVQKRKRVVFFVPRIAVGERGTAVAPTFHQSLVLRD